MRVGTLVKTTWSSDLGLILKKDICDEGAYKGQQVYLIHFLNGNNNMWYTKEYLEVICK